MIQLLVRGSGTCQRPKLARYRHFSNISVMSSSISKQAWSSMTNKDGSDYVGRHTLKNKRPSISFAKDLLEEDENMVIAFGDAKAVVSIDEYRTSKVCSWCNHYKVKGTMSQRDQEGHRHEIHGVRVCPLS